MATNYTPIIVGAAANADTFNDPMNELDAAIKKNNWIATGAPGVNHDTLAGYSVGSRWVDITNDIAYVCVDATTGAAIWLQSSVSAHDIVGAQHTITGAQYSLVGATALDTLGLLVPSADVSAGATAILRSNAGALTLAGLTIGGLTASTLIYSSAGKAITSLANSGAQSYLSNNGSGTLAWTAGTPIVGTPGTLTVSTPNAAADPHTHAVTSSANPGAAASLLASATTTGYLQLTGLGVGIAPDTTNGLLYVSVANVATSGSINASYSRMVATPSGASSGSYRGLFAYAEGAGGNNITGNVVGIFGQAVYSGSATISSLLGLSFSCTIGSGNATSVAAIDATIVHNSAGTTTTARGILLSMSKAAGTVTTAIGLSIANITVASTNYAIQTGLGTVEFGDMTRIIDKTSAALGVGGKLEIYGAYSGTSTTGAAKINAAKTTGTGGEWGFDLVFQTRLNGSGSVAEHARLISNGGFTLTPQADAVQFLCTGFSTQAVGTTVAQITRADAAAGISAMLGLTALGSGASGDGGSVLLNGKSSTTAAQAMGRIRWKWDTATHASRAASMVLSAYDTAERDVIEIGANGSAGTLGFFAATKVIKQIGCAVPTDLATCITAITALRTALNNYGLTTVV